MLPRWVWDFIRATAGDGGYAEVRGWKLDAVAPKYCSRPSVSDVTSPCPTKRDVYLRRSLKVRVESEILSLGKAVHEAFLYPHRRRGEDVERLIYGFRRALKQYQDLKRHWRLLECVFKKSLALSLIADEEQVPVSVEPCIPAGSIGLSDYVRPDLLVGFIPVDVVLIHGNHGLERKELALAGYALAIEAWIGHPVDMGVVIGVQASSEVKFTWRVVRVDDSLRRRFLDARDEVARILEYGDDPGTPPSCPSMCPYRGVCLSENTLRSRAGL